MKASKLVQRVPLSLTHFLKKETKPDDYGVPLWIFFGPVRLFLNFFLSPKGPPSSVFDTFDTASWSPLLQYLKKAFWALDIAPTLDVPVLFHLKWRNEPVQFWKCSLWTTAAGIRWRSWCITARSCFWGKLRSRRCPEGWRKWLSGLLAQWDSKFSFSVFLLYFATNWIVKNPKGHPFYNFKNFALLTLRYSADFRRSRLVSFMHNFYSFYNLLIFLIFTLTWFT